MYMKFNEENISIIESRQLAFLDDLFLCPTLVRF